MFSYLLTFLLALLPLCYYYFCFRHTCHGYNYEYLGVNVICYALRKFSYSRLECNPLGVALAVTCGADGFCV